MSALCISADSSSEEILPFAKMVHPIAAVGVIDVISTIDLALVFSDYLDNIGISGI